MNSKLLDTMYGNVLTEVNLSPVKFKDNFNYTLQPKSSDAFSLGVLTSIVATHYPKSAEPDVLSSQGIVFREAIPYEMADVFTKDYLKGLEYILCLKNQMLVNAASMIDLSKCTSVSFKRPGDGSSFFLDSDSYACIELRLYIKL